MSQSPDVHAEPSLSFVKALLRRHPGAQKLAVKLTGVRALAHAAAKHGIKVNAGGGIISFVRGDQVVRIGREHLLYGFDVANSFDYYFGAVEPVSYFGQKIVDYSLPRYHDVLGYDRHPIYFPSFSEPYVTTQQYVDFGQLGPGANVIDLGAYSALTSLVFKDIVGAEGTVIAVDADLNNLAAVEKNVANYKSLTGLTVEVLYGAVWRDDAGLEFSAEGNMGSSVATIVGSGRGALIRVPSFRLSDIADKFGLTHVDLIKADIEGAETVIFEDARFFERFSPKIVVEPHYVDGRDTSVKVIADLKQHGYECRAVPQFGSVTPLLECTPPAR